MTNAAAQGSQTSSLQFESMTPNIRLESDVVLAPETRRSFEEAIGALRYHKVIYSEWGFGAVDPAGRNMAINLYGPPGTGKTLGAQALAGTLGRKYIHVGISELESKYVGETAKNISRAFEAAELEGALLFFDEADTLLGARLSSVTQGIDNEINAMRSTMLIELEKFGGVVVFATNFAKNYDRAFVGRIRYHIEFKLPDLEGRGQLWRRFLVPGVPILEEHEALVMKCAEASDGMSGREIRTVLRLAFPRAVIDCPENPYVKWEHISRAIDAVRVAKLNIGGGFRTDEKSEHEHELTRRVLGIAE